MSEAEIAVSVIVPMLNAERYVSEALSSILQERSVSLELIVVNDCSTDRSADVVQTFNDSRCRLIQGPGRGISAAMNAGLDAARGCIIMWCDADDYYPRDRIVKQVEWLSQHPEYDVLCGAYRTVDEKGRLLAAFRCGDVEEEITHELLKGSIRTSYCTYAVRSTLIRKLGGFREFFVMAQDIDFQLRVGEAGRVYFFPDEVYCYRIHSESITHSRSTRAREFFEATAYRLHRQRRSGQADDLDLKRNIEKPAEGRSRAHSASLHAHELLLGQAWREHAAGSKWQAVHTGIRAVASYPLRLSAWKSVLALVAKSPGR